MRTILYQTGRQYSSHGQRIIITFDAPMAYFIDIDRQLQGYVWLPVSTVTAPSVYEIVTDVMQAYDKTDWVSHSFRVSECPEAFDSQHAQLQELQDAAKTASRDTDLLKIFEGLGPGSLWTPKEPRRHPDLIIIHVHEQTPPDKIVAKDFNSGQVRSVLLSEAIGDTEIDRRFHTALALAEHLHPGATLTYLGMAPDHYDGTTQFVFAKS